MRIGTIDTGRGRRGSIHVEAEISVKVETNEGGELSISGVIGALPSGNALGSCGQIDMGFQHRNPQDNDRRYGNDLYYRDTKSTGPMRAMTMPRELWGSDGHDNT